jgi:hypothetical protein
MNESSNDIARRERLSDWFKMNPDVWKDIEEELKINMYNETIQLKSRTPTCREFSAGYVYAYGEVLDLERYYRKVWSKPTSLQPK